MPNLSPAAIKQTILPFLLNRGFDEPAANTIADIFIENNLEGVDSHGIARFPNLIRAIDTGRVIATEGPRKIASFGAWEQWDGLAGSGQLNAKASMDRAIELAREFGLGCVALKRTNHWMRGGTYGRQAATAGLAGICWTNTMPNMPPWGSDDPRLGNNPLVIAVPHEKGPVVMDMAMTQFSYGKLEQHRIHGTQLPVAGGKDADGNLTKDPVAILESGNLLPAGFWKGSGLAFALDLLASLLASGNATSDIAKMQGEQQISQIFLAFDITRSAEKDVIKNKIQEAIAWLKGDSSDSVRYPGERAALSRAERLTNGIPIPEETWDAIEDLAIENDPSI